MTAQSLPAISVVVPSYGVSTLLADALDSLLAQDRHDWEAIVIDDGDPAVAAAVAPYADDPRIRLLQTENGGLPTARNRAIAAARAPLIALLDGDDSYRPGYLSAMIAAIDASPTIGFACCDATYFGHDRIGQLFSSRHPQALPATLERVLRREFNIFVCATIRRAAIDAVGGFDASLKSAEDLDLWLRLLGAGWDIAYVPQPLACYRRRPGQMSSNAAAMLESEMAVFVRAEQRLAGRREQIAAVEMQGRTARALQIERGIREIEAGAHRDGVAMLRAANAQRLSLRWRVAMVAMRAAPWLAGPLIRFRDLI